jgi:CheY-like chemotaxis protein
LSAVRNSDVITIALADDQHLVRQGIRCLLELEKDFKIIGETGDGIKVVGLVGRVKPSVLVVALGMPGLNGVEITRQVRQRSPDTGVVILSMSPDERCLGWPPLPERAVPAGRRRGLAAAEPASDARSVRLADEPGA